ncbi:uncharacterized protein LOC105693140 [Athalia rosae]|uniref:uncharacterized protein LOC105693140 n=1 Tax=Athalia rosae TaxID=37344 RepID=UPI0020346CB5|nr:uncharacterized protein LOC105693140 [Athalia rosae]
MSAAALIPGSVRASEIAASKIVELSKKCRERTAEVEALKTKCKNLESKLSESEIRLQCKKSRGNGMTGKSSYDSGDGNIDRPLTLEEELKCREEETKVLREKLHHINSKLYESKNTCTYLRQEINKAQKLLCSEVGDNVTIASLASSGQQNGWRGRAEQIQQLQQKITELQSKLSEYEGTCKGSVTGDDIAPIMKLDTIHSFVDTNSNATQKLYMAALTERGRCSRNLRNIEKEKRQKAEESAKELREMTLALEASKRKQDAAKARIKVLENDLTTAKQSVAIMNEKRSHDDQLIQALNVSCKSFSLIKCDTGQSTEILINFSLTDRSERNQSSTISCNYRNISPPSRGKSLNSPTVASRSNGDYNEYVILGMAAEAERKRLLELVVVLNRRLDEERFATDKMGETLRNERNKLARLETKLQRLEIERVGVTSGLHGGYKLRSSKSATATTTNENSQDDTRFKIELLEEKCLALEARLATVQRDKTSDLTLYTQMLDQARKTFQDAYRGKTPASNSCSMITI